MLHTVKEHSIRIPSSTPGIELVGKMFVPKSAEKKQWPAVLFIHGMPDSAEALPLTSIVPRSKLLAEQGFVTLSFACRGTEGSDGDFAGLAPADAVRDIGAAYRWLRDREEVQSDRIGLWGSSWGGYLSSMSLTDIHPASLFLSVPALYAEARYEQPLSQTTPEEKANFRTSFQGREHEAFRRLEAYNHPVFITIAEEDEMVPINCQVGYLMSAGNNAALQVHVLKGCKHVIKNDPDAEQKLRELIVEWFVKTLS